MIFVIPVLVLAIPNEPCAGAGIGTVRYENKIYNSNGFTGQTEFLPVRRAEVDLVDSTNTVLGSGTTDDTGFYMINVTNQGTKSVFIRIYARNTASPFNVTVKNSQSEGQMYTAFSPITNVDTNNIFTIDFDITIDSGGAPAFNIFDCAVWGFQYFQNQYQLAGLTLPSVVPLTIYWKTNSSGTFFDPGNNSIFLLGTSSDPDEYDDDVILHEIGHYMSVNYSRDDTPGGTHIITDQLDSRLSWSEGWAHYFSCIVRRFAGTTLYPAPQNFVDNSGSGAAFFEIETPSLSSTTIMAANEIAVAAVLWDIIDSANESFDTLTSDSINKLENQIWKSFIGMKNYTNLSLEDMAKGLFGVVTASEYTAITGSASADGIFKARSIRYYLDQNEPNNDINGSITLTLPFSGPQITHYFSPPTSTTKDKDFFKIVLAAGGVLKAETKTLGDGADTILRVFQSDGTTLVKENDDRFAGDKSSLVQTTLQAGTYYIVCENSPKSSNVVEFGYYDLSVSIVENLAPEILSLTADVTSGQAPLTVRFTVAASDADGTVSTYEWDVEGDSRFDFISVDGGNFAFTYQLSGTFNATVRVTDNKGESTSSSVQISVTGPTTSLQLAQNNAGGSAPVTTSFTLNATSITPVIYQWDFDSNNRIDLVTETDTANFTYTEPGLYVAKVIVRDNQGKIYSVGSSSISVTSSSAPTISSFTATPLTGTVPFSTNLQVNFIGSASICEFDIEGDGLFDVSVTNITGTSATANVVYTRPGTFTAVARLTNTSNVSSRSQVQVKATMSGTVGFIIEPEGAATVSGTAVTLSAVVYPSGLSKKVQFQHKSDSSTGPWTNIGAAITSANSSFKASWDTSTVTNLSVLDLRALIDDTVSTGDDSNTIQINNSSPTIKETSGSFTKEKTLSLLKGGKLITPTAELYVDYKSLSASSDVRLKFASVVINNPPANGTLLIVGDPVEVTSLTSGVTIQNVMKLRIFFKDDNNDGIVDTWNVTASSLGIYYLDELTGSWKHFFTPTVNTSEKWVEAPIHKFGKYAIYGVAGTPAPPTPTNEKSGGCFNVTSFARGDYALLILAALLAILCYRILLAIVRPVADH